MSFTILYTSLLPSNSSGIWQRNKQRLRCQCLICQWYLIPQFDIELWLVLAIMFGLSVSFGNSVCPGVIPWAKKTLTATKLNSWYSRSKIFLDMHICTHIHTHYRIYKLNKNKVKHITNVTPSSMNTGMHTTVLLHAQLFLFSREATVCDIFSVWIKNIKK